VSNLKEKIRTPRIKKKKHFRQSRKEGDRTDEEPSLQERLPVDCERDLSSGYDVREKTFHQFLFSTYTHVNASTRY